MHHQVSTSYLHPKPAAQSCGYPPTHPRPRTSKAMMLGRPVNERAILMALSIASAPLHSGSQIKDLGSRTKERSGASLTIDGQVSHRWASK